VYGPFPGVRKRLVTSTSTIAGVEVSGVIRSETGTREGLGFCVGKCIVAPSGGATSSLPTLDFLICNSIHSPRGVLGPASLAVQRDFFYEQGLRFQWNPSFDLDPIGSRSSLGESDSR
jgi:hypothetical protein